MSKLLDTIKGLNPLEQLKGGAVEVLKDGLGKAAEIFTNVQEGKLDLKQGLQEIEKLKIEGEQKLETAYIQDVQDARDLKKTEIQSDDKFVRRFSYYLAAITILLTFTLLILLYYVEIPKGNERIVDMALGSFIGAAMSIFVFFFGSTKGSKDKTEMMNKIIERKS